MGAIALQRAAGYRQKRRQEGRRQESRSRPPFLLGSADPLRGDWQGEGYVAQVVRADDGCSPSTISFPTRRTAASTVANIFRKFDRRQ